MSLILVGKRFGRFQASAAAGAAEDRCALTLDMDKCICCHKCEVDCKIENLVPEGIRLLRMVGLSPEESDGELRTYNVRASCHQCQLPACVSACPTGALKKSPEGIVYQDATACVGCRICELVCVNPGALSYDQGAKKILKCDLCLKRLHDGLEPACVAGCLMKALSIERVADLGIR